MAKNESVSGGQSEREKEKRRIRLKILNKRKIRKEKGEQIKRRKGEIEGKKETKEKKTGSREEDRFSGNREEKRYSDRFEKGCKNRTERRQRIEKVEERKIEALKFQRKKRNIEIQERKDMERDLENFLREIIDQVKSRIRYICKMRFKEKRKAEEEQKSIREEIDEKKQMWMI